MMKRLLTRRKKSHKGKIGLSGYSGTRKGGSASQRIPGALSAGTYHTCKTLTVGEFINAYCNNDLSGLLKSGEANDIQLQSAWNEILFDWSSLIKSSKSERILNLACEIGLLQWHIIYVEYAVIYLLLKYDEDIATQVQALGYEVPEFGSKGYESAINRIKSLAKTKVFELNNLRDEYKKIQKTSEGKSQTEEEFVGMVLILSKYQGYNIDRNITTVFEFAMIFNNYLSEVKQLEKSKA